MYKKLLVVFVGLGLIALQSFAQNLSQLQHNLKHLVSSFRGEVGIAVIYEGKDTITVNNGAHYPMMSVFKFHQAIAVAQELQRRNIPLDSMIYVKKRDLLSGTYSPLRDKYPEGNRNFKISELLTYTLQLSDNNACDILFDHVVDVKHTDAALRFLGTVDFAIVAAEREMNANSQLCYANWTTPLAATKLLDDFVRGSVLYGRYYEFVLQTMLACTIGQRRLPSGLPRAVRIGHKTGTSGLNERGEYVGVNDIGFVFLPDGRRYSVSVFVKDSKESVIICEDLIAKISKEVFNCLSKKEKHAR